MTQGGLQAVVRPGVCDLTDMALLDAIVAMSFGVNSCKAGSYGKLLTWCFASYGLVWMVMGCYQLASFSWGR